MDFVPLIERIGEDNTAMLGGALLGAVFGGCVQRTGFCTRMAVIDLARRRSVKAPAIWLLGFGAALLLVQYLLMSGMMAVGDSRYFATGQSLSGALVGGALFGIGMILTRGCISRLLVLTSSGNLRALFGVLVVAAVSATTLHGILSYPRDLVGAWLSSGFVGGNALYEPGGGLAGVVAGLFVTLAALVLALRARIGPSIVAGALLVGIAVAGGWYFTATLATQVFEPVAIDSLSFIRPLAQSAGWLTGVAGLPTFDLGLVAGTLSGGFLAALASGSFRIATFAEPGAPSLRRYALGAMLMGFGGVLAAGCTVGAGLTGGSVLAISALLAITAMVLAGALTDFLLDAPRERASAR
jgi:uncharacterized protein